MKESNILPSNAAIKQHQKVILLHTKGQYMKESNTLAGNTTIKQQQRAVLLNTKGWHMKELDSHAYIVINNILLGQILQSTKEIYIYNLPASTTEQFQVSFVQSLMPSHSKSRPN